MIFKKNIKKILLKRKFSSSRLISNNISLDVKLGESVFINDDVTIFNKVEIDDFSYINGNTIIGEGTKIGKYSSISYNCYIGLNEHPTKFLSTSPFLYSVRESENVNDNFKEVNSPVVIGNDVWIGVGTIILQGVTIGDGAIIAAGSVVTKDVAPYNIVGGIPAKLIKKRFEDDIIENLINFKWWNLPKNELEKYEPYFIGNICVDKIFNK
ncbi:CatB-related O-acetyltransferase [Macrococcus capreoli]